MMTSLQYKRILSHFIEDEIWIDFLDDLRDAWAKYQKDISDLRNYPNKDTSMMYLRRDEIINMCKEMEFREHFVIEPEFHTVRRAEKLCEFVTREGENIYNLICHK